MVLELGAMMLVVSLMEMVKIVEVVGEQLMEELMEPTITVVVEGDVTVVVDEAEVPSFWLVVVLYLVS